MNEYKKDFNKMLNDNMQPKIVTLEGDSAKKWGGSSMVVAPKKDYDNLIKTIPQGKITTSKELREKLAKNYKTEITCPLTAGIFTNIVAWASYQKKENKTPFWRVIKTNGELNSKFPEYPSLQKHLLEKEGFEIVEKKNKFFVKDFEKFIYKF